MVLAINVGIVVFLVWWFGYLHERASVRHFAAYDQSRDQYLAIIKDKDQRIVELDADYKALAESYIRETGKVYIRPAVTGSGGGRLDPAQPSAFRMRPPPWADPTKVRTNGGR